jgi:hypothetical protein
VLAPVGAFFWPGTGGQPRGRFKNAMKTNSQRQTAINGFELLHGDCEDPEQEQEHTGHDFLVQNLRPDLLDTSTHEHALRLLDFP